MCLRCAHLPSDVASVGIAHEVHPTAAELHRPRVSLHSKLHRPYDVLTSFQWHGWPVPGRSTHWEADRLLWALAVLVHRIGLVYFGI